MRLNDVIAGWPMSRHDEICANTLWGIHHGFPGRAHLVPTGRHAGLCGLQVHGLHELRPRVPYVCAECALAFVTILLGPVPTRSPT